MSEIYFEVVAGSRSYGLNIESSDKDVCQVSDAWLMGKDPQSNNHIIRVPKEEFIRRISEQQYNAYYMQWLFPYEFLSDNDLTKYIIDNRERYVQIRRRYVYGLFKNRADYMRVHAGTIYSTHPKTAAYSILFYSILTRYASGMSFKDSHMLEDGELKNFLLGVRRGQVSKEDALAKLEESKLNAESLYSFYDVEEDIEDVHQIIKDIKGLLLI